MNGQELETEEVARLLEEAQQALNQGDLVGMLDALAESGFLDGLKRRLQSKWEALPPSEVDDCAADAIAAACSWVSKGQSIGNLGGWLWKSATNIAHDRWKLDYSRRGKLGEIITSADMEPGEMFLDGAEYLEVKKMRRKEALRVARELLPEVGEGQVRDVMEIVLDAIENELPDLPASFIAGILDISENTARALVSRGFQRFRRSAAERGIQMPTDLSEIDTYYDEQESDNA